MILNRNPVSIIGNLWIAWWSLLCTYGKPYKLSVKAGIRTPEWVYNEGAQSFSYKKTRGARGKIKNPRESHIPIPWDPIYLKYFKKFIEQMGERYSGDDNCIAVTISGINSQSAEMHLPKEPEHIREWERLGDYKGKIVEATGKLTDIFATPFPDSSFVFIWRCRSRG